MASTEGDLTALKGNWRDGGLTWDDFGACTQNDLDGLKNLWFPDNVVNQIKIRGIWSRNHDRHQGKFNSLFQYSDFILMRFLFCFFC